MMTCFLVITFCTPLQGDLQFKPGLAPTPTIYAIQARELRRNAEFAHSVTEVSLPVRLPK